MQDEELMMRLAHGDAGAADLLVARYKNMLFAFLYRLTTNRSDAEDLFQETWLRVVRYRHTYRAPKKFSTWLFQIAVNCTRDFYKSTVKAKTLDGESALLSTEDGRHLEDRELTAMLMRQLPLPQREVIMLRYFHDMKETEIADLLEIPLGTVKSRLHKSLLYLKAHYGDEYARTLDG